MSAKDQHTKMGLRLRELRLERGLQQAEMARRLEISAAYLSLIEKGRRSVQLPLLFRALEIYGVTMEAFMESLGERRVDDGLQELLNDPLVRSLRLTEEDIASISADSKIVTTITALFNLYKSTRRQLDNVLEGLAHLERDGDGATEATPSAPDGGSSVLRFELTPFDEVTEFLEAHDNWFPDLEERADQAREELRLPLRYTSRELMAAMSRFDIDVRLVSPGAGESSVVRHWDPERAVLTVSSEMPEQRLRFQLAHSLGLRLITEEGLVERVAADASFRYEETRELVTIHLANYLAGALLLPYGDFFREVTRTRYDVELLASIFDSSYETVAHRVCNLADPQRRGLPFYFLRVDIAGNVSKRYSAIGPRLGYTTGSCPKSAVHLAFLTPPIIRRRYELYPDGSTYFVFAKVVSEPRGGSLSRGTTYSIGLGTHADNARFLAYADDMPFADPARMSLPVGESCRFCERTDCNQRAAPSYKFAFRVDANMKKDNFFSPLVESDERAHVAVEGRKPRA